MLKYIAALVFCAAIATAVNVDRCKELLGPREGTYGSANIEDVRVSDCSDSPCKLRKGDSTTIEFDFTPDKRYEKLTTAVYGGIGIVKVPFREIHGGDACKDIIRKSDGQKGCPLEQGTTYTYSNTFPILKSYPAVSVNVQYGLQDGKSSVVCFSLPSKITN